MIVTRELEVMYRCNVCKAKADVIDDLRCWCSTCWLKKEKKNDSNT
jgi:DNA-directed RNA polymerase subunit RPC12/RpoP